MKKISICIATWNRQKQLHDIIILLENQSMDSCDYEIIVVDSNSHDGTDEMMNILCSRYNNIEYINGVKNVLAAKRNEGINHSNSDIIVIIDDDVYPDYNFVSAHYKANIQNTDTFFCGQIRFLSNLCDTSNYYKFRNDQHLNSKDCNRLLKFNEVVVMNLSFRKQFIDTVGYFDETFIGYGCEDTEFGYRVIKSGYYLKYLDEALAIHHENSTNISVYGKKLYKAGLYGIRTLARVCPDAEKKLISSRVKWIGVLLGNRIVLKLLEKYLLFTDSMRSLYSYMIYKIYLYSCLYKGIKDQKIYSELTLKDASKGW